MAWHETPAAAVLGVRYPLVQAPMASVTTPALAAAVSNAGGLGSLGAAWLPPDELRAAIRGVRDLTDKPFLVSLFAWPDAPEVDETAVSAMREALRATREELGAADPEPSAPDVHAHLAAQLEVVLAERVPVFGFIFGIPDFRALQEAGSRRRVARHGLHRLGREPGGRGLPARAPPDAGGRHHGDDRALGTAREARPYDRRRADRAVRDRHGAVSDAALADAAATGGGRGKWR